jgi:two-component system sensor histidine kinase KdpD
VDTEDTRPDPDALLAQVRADEAKARRGRLKIFFGMCPGVGKTYTMLENARRRVAEGIEVVVGIVETHGRKETQAMLEGLPVAPRIEIEHRGATLNEIDLDALKLWRPGLVLVDELAHTNAPGSRHPKRYQDVLELLDAGISVFTTLNVQHVESRIDTVRQVTGVTVRETVPDSILDVADEIVLVDLTPEQLRQRLAEGKVYLGERAALASENFFREENLAALREMALRLTAEHVDRHLRTLRAAGAREPWCSGDRLLVAVSASPHSAELLRWTRRYAASLEAAWIAVAVEIPTPLSEPDAQRLSAHLALARQLGGEVVLTAGAHVGEALLRVAHQRGVTQMILGKPDGPAWRWAFARRSPVAWLIQNSGGIDIQLVRTERPDSAMLEAASGRQIAWSGYAAALGIAAGGTAIGLAAVSWIGYWSVALLYLLAVMLGSLVLRRGPALMLGALGALLWNFLFIPPLYTFYISAPHDGMMFAMFFIVAIVIGHLTTKLRDREQLERRREARSTALYELTHALAKCATRDDAVRLLVEKLRQAFGLKAAVMLREDGGEFGGRVHPASAWTPTAKEEGVAGWAFQNRRPAGRTTDTLPDSDGLHLPLLVAERVEGVLAIEMPPSSAPAPEQRELLDAFGVQLALVAEKGRLALAQQRAQVLAESEKLQRTLFDSVSHELKTPIAAITAALDQESPQLDEIRRAAQRLRRAVDNLLDATRLESGALTLNLEWCDAAELAHDAVPLTGLNSAQVELDLSPELPPVRADAALVSQVLATLLHNAVTHGASSEPPVLTARRGDGFLCYEVSDRGPGLPDGMEERVFRKFARGAGIPAGGLGLGLSIARRLAELHSGSLTAENRPSGGVRFTLRLPLGGEMKMPA